ncbi:MAG: S8 family serine peptidase [Bacteroidales bacterium]|nr:S8 family serine peptidase [Bacteroidales bacterium]
MKKLFLTMILALTCIIGVNAQHVHPDYVDGLIYMKLIDSYPLNFYVDVNNGRSVRAAEFPFLKEVFEKYGVVYVGQTLYLFDDPKLLRTLTISFTEQDKVDEFIAELEQFEQIEYAEKRVLKHLSDFTPNDPYFTSQCGGYSLDLKWHLDMIYAEAAWGLQKGSSSVKVAVVDNAVYGAHEDLGISSSNLCTVKGTISGYYITNISYSTGSANPPTSVGQTASQYNEDPYEWSHGTHCAGLVGAKLNNGVGVASIGGGVTLMGVRVTMDDGSMYFTEEGVQWAADNGANVISMSFGSTQSSQTEQQLLNTCYNKGIILVAAAGNEGDEDNQVNYPGGYSQVISVASVNSNGKLSYFSQYGSGRADIAAPGGFDGNDQGMNILSTTYCKSYTMPYYYSSYSSIASQFSGKYYDGMQGTSMATPIVAGLCGLLKSACPSLTPAQAKTVLQTTQKSLTSGSHTIDGHGYINAYSAVKYVQDNICPQSGSCGTPTNLSYTATTSSIKLTWTAVSGANSYQVFRNSSQIGTTTATNYTDNNVSSGVTYSYTVKAVCSSGVSNASNSVSAQVTSTSCGTPTNVTATAMSSSIKVTWTGVSGANSYQVFRNSSQIGTTTSTSYTDNSAAAGTSYTYKVKAVCSNGVSGESNGATAQIPGGGGSATCAYKGYPLSDLEVLYAGEDGGDGYVAGTNVYGDLAKANYYTNSGTVTISKMKVTIAGGSNLSGSVVFTIWSNNNGKPGSVLGSKSVTLSEIANNLNSNQEYECTFNSPISVTGNFFAGVDNSNVSGYYGLQVSETSTNVAWEKTSSGTWMATTEANSWNMKMTFAIFPYVCSNNGGGGNTGIADFNAVDFHIYPNPASDFITVVLPEGMEGAQMQIFDLSGKLINTQNLNETNNTINVNSMASGLYFVKIGNTTKKFVKE